METKHKGNWTNGKWVCSNNCPAKHETNTEVKEWEKEFDESFEYESEGCSECSGYSLIDKTKIPYPQGVYHQEYDLDKIKTFIHQQLQKAREEKDKYYENILRHKVKEAWIQGNIISFEEPTYKSAFFDVESVFVLYPIVPDHSELDQE